MKFVALAFLCIAQAISIQANTLEFVYPPQGSFAGKIVGGKDAKEGDAPFQCSMQVNKRHFCGCSILSSKWILTAAHCTAGQKPENVEIIVGTIDLKNGGKAYQSKKFFAHEKHDSPRFSNDIALILINEEIKFDDKVKPIDLATEDTPADSTLQLTGWGRLTAGGIAPQILQIITLKSISNQKCRTDLGANVHEGHLCTFNKVGEGACNGDSGGPLVLKNKVVGVVNFGVPCARGKPDAFANVAYYYDWLQNIMKNN